MGMEFPKQVRIKGEMPKRRISPADIYIFTMEPFGTVGTMKPQFYCTVRKCYSSTVASYVVVATVGSTRVRSVFPYLAGNESREPAPAFKRIQKYCFPPRIAMSPVSFLSNKRASRLEMPSHLLPLQSKYRDGRLVRILSRKHASMDV